MSSPFNGVSFKDMFFKHAVDEEWLSLGECELILNLNSERYIDLGRTLEDMGIPDCEQIDHNIFTAIGAYLHTKEGEI